MSLLKEGQKSVRIVLSDALYQAVKSECPDHGDLSRLVRNLLKKHLRSIYVDQPEIAELIASEE